MLAGRGRGPFGAGVARVRGWGKEEEDDDNDVLMGAGVAAGAASIIGCAGAMSMFGGSVCKSSLGSCMQSSSAAGRTTIVADESGVDIGGSARPGLSLSSGLKGLARVGIPRESAGNRGRSGRASAEGFLLAPQRKLKDLLRGRLNLLLRVCMVAENDCLLAGAGASTAESFHGAGSWVICTGGVLSSSVVP